MVSYLEGVMEDHPGAGSVKVRHISLTAVDSTAQVVTPPEWRALLDQQPPDGLDFFITSPILQRAIGKLLAISHLFEG